MTTLTADLVAQQQKGEEPGQHITEKAKQLLAQLLLPKQITGRLIEKYIRKAMRTGAWRKLPPQTKALLYTSKLFPKFKSKTIIQLLKELLIRIEMLEIRGKALYHGILIYLKKGTFNLKHKIFSTIKKSLEEILSIGINYINNPILFYRTI